MAYFLKWRLEVCWVGDGAGPMEVPGAQTKILNNDQIGGTVNNSGYVVVPGADAPTGANFTTACTTVGTNMGTACNVAATLAQIQAFATGGL